MELIETTATPRFELSWSWERSRHLRAQQAMWRYRIRNRKRVLLMVGILGAAAILLGYWMFDAVGSSLLFAAFVGVSGWSGGLIGQRLLPWIQARRFERKCLPKYELFVFVLGTQGLEVQNGDATIQLGWSAFKRWVETEEFLLFYTDRAVGYYLPRRAVLPEQLPLVRQFLDGALVPAARDGA